MLIFLCQLQLLSDQTRPRWETAGGEATAAKEPFTIPVFPPHSLLYCESAASDAETGESPAHKSPGIRGGENPPASLVPACRATVMPAPCAGSSLRCREPAPLLKAAPWTAARRPAHTTPVFHLSVCLSVFLFVRLSLCLFDCFFSLCLSVCLFVSLSV